VRREIYRFVVADNGRQIEFLFLKALPHLGGARAAGVTDLRSTHNAVLRFLDEEGTRANVLAACSALTRQAPTQSIDDLERLGYVARRAYPLDRRAKVVVYTDRGRAAFRAGRDLEAAYAARLGDSKGPGASRRPPRPDPDARVLDPYGARSTVFAGETDT
jgi:DNA-binding MarR family transcriptional regulator